MAMPLEGARARDDAARGKALREAVPRTSHGYAVVADRPDPVELLQASAAGRLPYLLPLRYARMFDSPFAFYRGSAVIMASDLATSPVTGLRVQAGGDAHCLNFGGFATPERNVIFDLNDFDETLPGPWEWDLKRLATSFVLASRHNGHSAREAGLAALEAARTYRTAVRELASQSALDVWYARIDARDILDEAHAAKTTRQAALDRLTERAPDGALRFRDDPPTLFHSAETDRIGFDIEAILAAYPQTLGDDVAHLFARYRLIDHAIKVVGVGSVGTRCGIALFVADDRDAIVLQVKEATASVLEAHVGSSAYANHGERVVRGQRLMQAASDLFLGWSSSGAHSFYVRQFKDMKASADIETASAHDVRAYARYCARALATAHARSGSAAAIGGYLGRADTFDCALLAFAIDYADQAERDYERFAAAVEDGDVPVADESETHLAVARA